MGLLLPLPRGTEPKDWLAAPTSLLKDIFGCFEPSLDLTGKGLTYSSPSGAQCAKSRFHLASLLLLLYDFPNTFIGSLVLSYGI